MFGVKDSHGAGRGGRRSCGARPRTLGLRGREQQKMGGGAGQGQGGTHADARRAHALVQRAQPFLSDDALQEAQRRNLRSAAHLQKVSAIRSAVGAEEEEEQERWQRGWLPGPAWPTVRAL